MKRLVLAAAAFLAGACSTGPTTVGLRLSEPSAVVAYRGVAFASPNDAVRPLLAVASRRSDDLRLIDPNTDLPIFGPGVIFPLTIPTAPRPQLLASASLGDGGADVLVAVSAGSTSLQVIETWTEKGRLAFPPVPLGALDPDAEILSVLGVPATRDASGNVLVNARVLVAATGTRLVVVEFKRAADGKAVELASTPPTVTPLTFNVLDMALLPPPSDLPNERRVFLASREAVGTDAAGDIFGVGELDGAADLMLPLTIKPLDARARTVAVAAGRVDERGPDTNAPCSPYAFPGTPKVRVYAALDQSDCGPGRRINCGIATLDPDAGGLADDLGSLAHTSQVVTVPDDVDHPGGFVSFQPYRAPMPVVGVPLHIAIGFAPAAGTFRHTTDQLVPSGCSASPNTPQLRLQPSAGLIDTSAVAMVTSSDGHVYWYDLGRSAPVNDTSAVVGGTRAGVTSASTSPLTAGTWALGLWPDASGIDSSVLPTADPTLLPLAIQTWPGFTEGATWKLIWQGPLPSLQSRAGVIATNGGEVFASFQTPVDVTDPALGVHPTLAHPDQDIVELPSLGCEASIAEVVPAGDLRLPTGAPFDKGAARLVDVPRFPSSGLPCLTLGATPTFATLTVRASGLVLVNDHSGYMGRPVLDQPFVHAWLLAESTLGDKDPVSEKLALARKARRVFYPINSPCPVPGAAAGSQGAQSTGCYGYVGFPPNSSVLNNPLSPGPALRLRPGLTFIAATGVTPGQPSIARDTTLSFATSAGLIITSRRPAVGGALPANLAVVDRTDTTKGFSGHDNEGVRFYVPYADDQVIEFSADGTATGVTSLR